MLMPIKCHIIFIFSLFITSLAFAQKTTDDYHITDSIALNIPEASTHTTDGLANYFNSKLIKPDDKMRGIFVWIINNFTYVIPDLDNLKLTDTTDDKVTKALTTRKGICENYAAVLNEVCNKMGIRSYFVTGYTKLADKVNTLPHAWCVTEINNKWYVYDPTWASGYVNNKNEFIKHTENYWYKASPLSAINSHIPFDPMWELLNYPISNADFLEGNITQNPKQTFFSYTDSINVWDKQTVLQQLNASARRVEQNGIVTPLIAERLNNIKEEIAYLKKSVIIKKHNDAVLIYNASANDFNQAVRFLNTFIQFRNHQFSPECSDKVLQSMIDSADSRIINARKKINSINPTEDTKDMIASLRKSQNQLNDHINKQKAFLAKYLLLNTPDRKAMFFKNAPASIQNIK